MIEEITDIIKQTCKENRFFCNWIFLFGWIFRLSLDIWEKKNKSCSLATCLGGKTCFIQQMLIWFVMIFNYFLFFKWKVKKRISDFYIMTQSCSNKDKLFKIELIITDGYTRNNKIINWKKILIRVVFCSDLEAKEKDFHFSR